MWIRRQARQYSRASRPQTARQGEWLGGRPIFQPTMTTRTEASQKTAPTLRGLS